MLKRRIKINKSTKATDTSNKLTITPDTKIAALLDAYPELEAHLIKLAPAFKKLKNPVLRKTIAKVANLNQAAQLGNISLGKLINELRSVVGQEKIIMNNRDKDIMQSAAPEWVSGGQIVNSLDARPLLNAGEHPVNIVMKEISMLNPNQIFELITPFSPVPLVDMAKTKGFQTWTKQEESELFRTYFAKI
jgi:hypothetical protein